MDARKYQENCHDNCNTPSINLLNENNVPFINFPSLCQVTLDEPYLAARGTTTRYEARIFGPVASGPGLPWLGTQGDA
jgi:hypothetical protein